MSLDVYLTIEGVSTLRTEDQICIREDGQTKVISRAEWDERFPDREPIVIPAGVYEDASVYSANITHNLNSMAEEAGIYRYLWRPGETGVELAAQLIEPLEVGIALLESDPERFKALNPSNGWGTYEGLVAFVGNYLEACRQYPTASVSVSR